MGTGRAWPVTARGATEISEASDRLWCKKLLAIRPMLAIGWC